MFHRRDNKILIWAAFGLLFVALAAGAVMTIQPVGAQAPSALPRSAPPAVLKASMAQRGNPAPVSRANPQAHVPVLQGQVSQAQSHSGTAPARAEVANVPEYSI